MGTSENAVKQRLLRGRKMLKEQVSSFVEDALGDALADIDRVRPTRIRRPYMRIALELYADHLAAQQSGSK